MHYHKQGRYQQAELPYLQLLTIFEEENGSTYPDAALSLTKLALFYEDMDKDKEAKILYQPAW